MKVTNKYGLPDPIVKAVELDEHKQADVSVTGLINPTQLSVLTKRHWDDIEVDAADRIWLLLGKSVHYVLDKACPDSATEVYMEHEINGVKVSGSVDYFDRKSRLVTDYKVTSVYAVKDGAVKPEWEAQLNLYDYLLTLSGEKVERLQIVAILRDWSESQAVQENYPKSAVVTMSVRKWSRDKQETYLKERIALWQSGMGGFIHDCTEDERWAKPPVWAVKKEGNKRANKLFDMEEPAKKYAEENKMIVEYRPGESTRCVRYCPVRRFCKQGMSYMIGVEE